MQSATASPSPQRKKRYLVGDVGSRKEKRKKKGGGGDGFLGHWLPTPAKKRVCRLS